LSRKLLETLVVMLTMYKLVGSSKLSCPPFNLLDIASRVFYPISWSHEYINSLSTTKRTSWVISLLDLGLSSPDSLPLERAHHSGPGAIAYNTQIGSGLLASDVVNMGMPGAVSVLIDSKHLNLKAMRCPHTKDLPLQTQH